MNEQDQLLARLYVALKYEYITSRLKPVYDDLRQYLTATGGSPLEKMSDAALLQTFIPAPVEPSSADEIAAAQVNEDRPSRKRSIK